MGENHQRNSFNKYTFIMLLLKEGEQKKRKLKY